DGRGCVRTWCPPSTEDAIRRRVTPGSLLGERAELVVQWRLGHPVGQGGHGVGTDAEDDLQGVADRVPVRQEGLQRVIRYRASRVEDVEGERLDRGQPLLRRRLAVPERGDGVAAGAQR